MAQTWSFPTARLRVTKSAAMQLPEGSQTRPAPQLVPGAAERVVQRPSTQSPTRHGSVVTQSIASVHIASASASASPFASLAPPSANGGGASGVLSDPRSVLASTIPASSPASLPVPPSAAFPQADSNIDTVVHATTASMTSDRLSLWPEGLRGDRGRGGRKVRDGERGRQRNRSIVGRLRGSVIRRSAIRSPQSPVPASAVRQPRSGIRMSAVRPSACLQSAIRGQRPAIHRPLSAGGWALSPVRRLGAGQSCHWLGVPRQRPGPRRRPRPEGEGPTPRPRPAPAEGGKRP